MAKTVVVAVAIAALALVLGGACGGKRGEDAATGAPQPADTMTARAAQPETASEDPRFARFAAARARLAAGRKAFDEGNSGRAMIEAQRGLDALGDD